MDALSEVMASVRLTSSAFLDARLHAPWCIAARVGPDDCAPLGRVPAQIVTYHYLISGRLFITLDPDPPVEVGDGELLLLPRNDRHALGSAPGLRPAVIEHLIRPADGGRPAALQLGGRGEETHLICGFLGCDVPDNPLLSALPPLLRLKADGLDGECWLGDSFQHAARTFAAGGFGSTAVLSRFAELLFVEAVRRYLVSLPAMQTGWLAGLRDRTVGRALALLHARPAEPWTTARLAHRVGLSRSAFAERFKTLVGRPPMHYLTHWRLQLAAMRLRESSRSTAQIAADVGYASEAAFSRAFRRAFGIAPGAWRRGQGMPAHTDPAS